ncbi:MAG: hypothetical protein QG635_1617 [Bacteroidota bacterium]|nr:hypothetical protein [Bacteroidota bacterium]
MVEISKGTHPLIPSQEGNKNFSFAKGEQGGFKNDKKIIANMD